MIKRKVKDLINTEWRYLPGELIDYMKKKRVVYSDPKNTTNAYLKNAKSWYNKSEGIRVSDHWNYKISHHFNSYSHEEDYDIHYKNALKNNPNIKYGQKILVKDDSVKMPTNIATQEGKWYVGEYDEDKKIWILESEYIKTDN